MEEREREDGYVDYEHAEETAQVHENPLAGGVGVHVCVTAERRSRLCDEDFLEPAKKKKNLRRKILLSR